MKKGNVLVEQITAGGDIVEGYDESLSLSGIYNKIKKYFPEITKLPD